MHVGKSQKCQNPGILWPPIAAIGFGQFLAILGQFRVCYPFSWPKRVRMALYHVLWY